MSDNQRSVSIPVIDLNSDLGEHDGSGYSTDIALLGVASSANIACGEHAGSIEVTRRTVALAEERGVTIGAHPGYPDRERFGRRELGLPMEAIITSVERQLERIAECCASQNARLRYVKPHGALYNRAAKDSELADALAICIEGFDPSLTMLTLPECALYRAAAARGLRVAREAFVDRAFMPDGTLVPRDQSGALIDDPATAARRAVSIARDKTVAAIDGSMIDVAADSLCVHGDGAHALETMSAARAALEEAGFTIQPFAP